VVESGGAKEIPPAADEKSVATDRATLQFRKYYYQTLRHSGSAVRENVHFRRGCRYAKPV
jgi:hypothetical protein